MKLLFCRIDENLEQISGSRIQDIKNQNKKKTFCPHFLDKTKTAGIRVGKNGPWAYLFVRKDYLNLANTYN